MKMGIRKIAVISKLPLTSSLKVKERIGSRKTY
jgi:hypothetical protein